MRRLMELVRHGRLDLTPLLTHRFSLDRHRRGVRAVRESARRRDQGRDHAMTALAQSGVATMTLSPTAARVDARPVFHARGLCKIYRTGDVEVHALRALDLDLYRGELLVMLGASGSGKSTLLNILGGLDTADERHGAVRGPRSHEHGSAASSPVPARARRVRVPVLQPDPEPHRARERRARDGHRRAPMAPEDGAGAGGARRPARPLSGAALRRRAAARRDRARDRQAARRAAVRRAHRRARRGDRARWCSTRSTA